MKKAIIILSVVLLASCDKREHDRDNDEVKTCQTVSNDQVPSTVQSGFQTKYPQNTVEKWFNKDNKGFAALFTLNGSKMISQFDNSGTFQTENVAPTACPNAGNHPPHQGCNGHHKHHLMFGFRPHKHHGNCDRDHEKETECQVQVLN